MEPTFLTDCSEKKTEHPPETGQVGLGGGGQRMKAGALWRASPSQVWLCS